MPLRKTEAFVLKKLSSGETSLIVRLYSKEYGKISVIAKGARKIKNRFSGILEPLNKVSLIYYHHEAKDLYMLSQCDLIDSFDSIRDDFQKTTVSFAVVESVMNTVIGEEENTELYELVINVINYIACSPKNYLNYYWYFLINLAKISGSGLFFRECDQVSGNNPIAYYPEEGCIICGNNIQVSGESINISAETFRILKSFYGKNPGSLGRLKISQTAELQLNSVLNRHLSRHLTGFKPSRSMEIYKSLENGLE